jgi:flagellar capping protein FliD
LVAEWFVTSEDKLRFLMDGIIVLCNTYNARCYINVNPKSEKEVLWNIAESALERLKTNAGNAVSILSHSHDSVQGNGVKYWVIDIDDLSMDLEGLRARINSAKSGFETNIVAELPSKTGLHLITNPFDLRTLSVPYDFSGSIDVKKNASTLLYCL